jgi:hypothetical protein
MVLFPPCGLDPIFTSGAETIDTNFISLFILAQLGPEPEVPLMISERGQTHGLGRIAAARQKYVVALPWDTPVEALEFSRRHRHR